MNNPYLVVVGFAGLASLAILFLSLYLSKNPQQVEEHFIEDFDSGKTQPNIYIQNFNGDTHPSFATLTDELGETRGAPSLGEYNEKMALLEEEDRDFDQPVSRFSPFKKKE